MGSNKKVLVITAVDAEKDALLRGIGVAGSSRIEVIAAGVGPAAAAAGTAAVLASASAAGEDYGLVVSAGIGGGFAGQADEGSLVVASDIIAADLGVRTREGFSGVDELGFGSTRLQADAALSAKLEAALRTAGLQAHRGPVLTVSTVTGTAEAATELAVRIPGAAAEAMEGFGVATAAHLCGVPFLEVRAVSNRVGPRDRAAWRMKEAFQALEAAGAIFLEVFYS